ncbi:MAG: glycoside hydrolase family 5 protein [Acidobacteriota bacterium]|nr:glycoside hydrolase family 5 protein [Acidobacteriota bacterium]
MPKRIAFALLFALAPLFAPSFATRAPVAAVAPSSRASEPGARVEGGPVRADEGASRVAWARAAHLRRGINLSHWFAQSPGGDYSENHLRTHTTERDINAIKSLGFDHVRFTFEPAPLFDEAHPSDLNADYLRRLDSALDLLLASGLSVVFDVHPSDDFKTRLRTDDRHVEAFAEFWRALARHLSARDPERLFLEILNEPVIEDAYRWMGIQARVAAAIRDAAPRHTIIAAGPRWSSVEELLRIEPLADRNVIYNFHLYDPHTFTHQGATWGASAWPYLKGVPYPSSPEAVAGLLTSVENESARQALKAYGEERWNAERIERMVALADGWAQRRGVPLTCNEFGVYRAFAPADARLRWIEDVRAALERHRIGWTMWDYAGGFGVAVRKDGRAEIDPRTVAALGLSGKTSGRSGPR